MMEDSDEDFQWDPEVRKMLDDISWEKDLERSEVKLDSGIHLLQSGVMCYPSMLLELFKDKNVVLNDGSKIPTPRIPYPRVSLLTKSEMENYIKMLKKFKTKKITDVSNKLQNQFRDFKQLQTKIIKEQEEYQHYLMQIAPQFISEYNSVDRDAVQWMQIVLNYAAIQIKNYERYYVHLHDFGISVMPFKNDSLPTPFENLIVHLGTLKHLRTVTTSVEIPKNINYKYKSKSNADTEMTWKKTVISKDENARRLAIAWNADIVISHGSLQVLADNHSPFSNEWEIPIIVKEIADSEFGAKRKVAFVDKVLPPKRVTPREKNYRYFKEVFKHIAEAQNVWDRFPTSEDAVQEEAQIKNEKNRKTSSSEFGSDGNTDNELMMQVDGASDKKTKKKKHDTKTSTGISEHEKSKLAQTSKFPSFTELSAREVFDKSKLTKRKNVDPLMQNESAGFQAFIGKNSPDESTKKSSTKKTVKSKFPGMSFDLLPDSAMAVSHDENEIGDESKSIEPPEDITIKLESEEEVDNDESETTSALFATRKSPRNSVSRKKKTEKPDQSNLFSSFGKFSEKQAKNFKTSSKMVTSTPAVSKKKPRRHSRLLTIDESDSDDDCSLSIIKRMIKKYTGSEAENTTSDVVSEEVNTQNTTSDLLSTILPAQNDHTPEEISGTSKLVSLKPFKPQTDLLGQILGKPTGQNRRKDIASAWSNEAKSLREGDVGLKYSSSDISLISPTPCRNVSYALWKFGKAKVLIRYKLHGKLTAPTFGKKTEKKIGGVSLRTKLEYQSNHVFEQLTMSEMCRDWVTMLFKRPTKLVRARIDPFKREILDVEWLMTLNHLNDKADQMGYNTAVTSKLLMKLFQMISGLGGGSYLCCHRADENKVVIRKSVDDIRKKVVYDLHREYARPGRDVCYSTSVPWIPGDPNKPRKFHNSNDRVPMTFEPREGKKNKKK